MKRNLRNLLLTASVSLGMAVNGMGAYAAEVPSGSSAVKVGTTYTVAQMLTYAMQDEYAAQAEYSAIIKAFNTTRPFSNIMKAEETHISELEPLFKTYKVELPKRISESDIVLPKTLTESYSIGVEAEIKNIAMYETFLKQELPTDVKLVFEALKKASENHLKAFKNAESRGGGVGYGRQK